MPKPKLSRRRTRLPRQNARRTRRITRVNLSGGLVQMAGARATSALREELLSTLGRGQDTSTRLLRLGVGQTFDAALGRQSWTRAGLDVATGLASTLTQKIVGGIFQPLSRGQESADFFRLFLRGQKWL